MVKPKTSAERRQFREKPFNQSENNRKVIQKLKRGHQNKPKGGQNDEIEKVVSQYKDLDKDIACTFQQFSDFPLSRPTLSGLEKHGFTKPTDIQRQSLAWSLTGSDVVGAAKTGSGKTLALIIPVLECLWRNRWTQADGLGALIIVPTRELAYQIFEVINKVGQNHNLSAALLIGGTEVDYQLRRLFAMNIIICTPGRLLQHLEENSNFNVDQLQVLVIDEADRILDLGFKTQMDAILDYLPIQRQTLLFSATQTRKVDDLVRVSVKDPVFVDVHEHADKVTPDKLQQARFLTETLRHLRPGLSLTGLWGTQKQNKRLETFETFDRNKRGAALIATDIASRGLDFRNLDWVLQLDCPPTVEDYIHRVGRTARMGKNGEAVLVLTPSQEEPFVKMLNQRHIPIEVITPDERRIRDVRQKLMSTIATFPELKDFAQKSILDYARAIYFAKVKSVFDVSKIDFTALAEQKSETNDESEENVKPSLRRLIKKPKMESGDETETIEIATKSSNQLLDSADENEDEKDVFKVTRRDVFKSIDEPKKEELRTGSANKQLTKQQLAKRMLKKKNIVYNNRIVFNDDDDQEIQPQNKLDTTDFDIEEAKQQLEAEDAEDKKRHRELLKKLKKEKRNKHKETEIDDDELDLGDDDAEMQWQEDSGSNESEMEDD
ncbi:RNA helicase [Aphelenchoides besseyi]|nr:RNA helicase [Aphelenchoides besseyi]